MIRGRALVEEGDGAKGLAEIRDGLDDLRRTGLNLGDSLLVSLATRSLASHVGW